MALESINPATGAVIARYEAMSDEQVDAVVNGCHQTFIDWRETPFADRAALMRKVAGLLRERQDDYARLMTEEMGKPLAAGRGEAEKCAWVCDYYADNAERFLQPEQIDSNASLSQVVYRPLGVVLAVMPWNFPFWQVFRFAAPGLMAGNTALLKHASNVCGSALAIEQVFRDAGFPEQAFRTLLIGSKGVARVIENPKVMAVTLTGSTPAGKAVAAKAGEQLKKTVLELGGSDPYLVLADADLDAATETCVNSRLINSGQSCIAAKRFIVERPVLQAFEQGFVELMKNKKMGDPMDEDNHIGPQARVDLRDELHDQVQRSIDGGARCLLGGELPAGPGAFYPPTVLTDVGPGMAAFDEELFGPVAAIVPAEDEDDAVAKANRTEFGLGAAVFTGDRERGLRIAADRLEAGCCFVNELVQSDPRLPFGGIKQSGYGRELSHHGIKEFVNIKTVYLK